MLAAVLYRSSVSLYPLLVLVPVYPSVVGKLQYSRVMYLSLHSYVLGPWSAVYQQ